MPETVLVIVESPTKAKTIRKFLPKHFIVEASVGHVRDLPQTAADVPKEYKGQEWARIGIDVDHDFAPLYVTSKGKGKIIAVLRKAAKEAATIYLATDEDREGESISWHLIEVLNLEKAKGKTVKRLVFHEITKSAIEESLLHPRDLDMDLVRAQEARRVIDRLYGFTLSPLLWKKIAYGLSAGRVQSPGLRLIVQREFERVAFKVSVFWDLLAKLKAGSQGPFEARLIEAHTKKIATGKDFDADTGELKGGKNTLVLGAEEAKALEAKLRNAVWKVTDLTEKEQITRPSIPFTTSTLQQEGNRKLGLPSRDTMRIAQKLYEEGLITYMRTDSPTLSSEAIGGARRSIEELFGAQYLSPTPRQYSAKSRNAQEAHEAIRPAGAHFQHPDQTGLTGKDKQLYEMIWKRTLGTQMADAKKLSLSVRIEADDTVFQANGSRIIFPGFLRVYVEGSDDPEAALEDKEVILPPLAVGQTLTLDDLSPALHETKPPARYTEASLIQRLEKEGIGRPSTYASIISVLYERDYVRKAGNALIPTYTGVCVIQFLEKNFNELVEYSFTSGMETALDDIAGGERDRTGYLKEFYFGDNGLKHRVESRDRAIKPDESRTIHLPQLAGLTDVRVGRFGPYVVTTADGNEIHASIPEDIPPGELSPEQINAVIAIQKDGPVSLGDDPATQLPIYCLTGRFGPYVQLGPATEENPKPKRATLPKGVEPSQVNLELALKLLSLPRVLGVHPDTGKEVATNNGRFGPFVVHDGVFRSLRKEDDVYTITLERALVLLSEERLARGRAAAKVLREVGLDSDGKTPIQLLDGRYGPYLKVGKLNVSIPEELRKPEALASLTVETARELAALAADKPAAKGKKKAASKAPAKAEAKTKIKTKAKPKEEVPEEAAPKKKATLIKKSAASKTSNSPTRR